MFATMADVVAIYDAMWQMLLPLWLMLLPFISCLLAGVIANYILFCWQMLFARVADGIAYPGGCGV